MKLRFTHKADRDYAGLSPQVRKAFAKQIDFLLSNPQHSSLHAEKHGEEAIFGRPESREVAVYFKILGDECVIISTKAHPK